MSDEERKRWFMAGAKAMLREIGERVTECIDNCQDFDCVCGSAYFDFFAGEPSDDTLQQPRLDGLWDKVVEDQ